MILLDTNILSAAVNSFANEPVRTWIDRQPSGTLFLCAPVLAEVRFGCDLLPEGARKSRIADGYTRLEEQLFAGRVLAFGRAAALEFARIRALRQRAGRPFPPMDALIAAIALANSMTLATRNTRDFEGIGLPLINPFETAIP